jgi:hypothetical protein
MPKYRKLKQIDRLAKALGVPAEALLELVDDTVRSPAYR